MTADAAACRVGLSSDRPRNLFAPAAKAGRLIIGGPLVILPRELQISQLQISQLIASETKSPLRARNFISNLNVVRRRTKNGTKIVIPRRGIGT
jgi:hypothetical protein